MSENKTRYLFSNDYAFNPLNLGSISLIQIGRRYCAPTEIIHAHPHLNWFELTVITGGTGQIITNGEITPVKSGDIYLSFPCDVHEIRVGKTDKLEYDFLAFFCEEKELKKALNAITRNFRGGESRIFKDEKISDLVKNAIMEFSTKDQPFTNLALADLIRLIIIYLIRDFNDIKQKTPDVSEAEVLCFQLMNYIDTHVYSLQKLSDVAPKFNYNYSYLSKLFKKVTGKTLLDYLLSRKMQIAKALILERKKTVGEIAEMLGYNLYSFSKAFKSAYGVSPKNLQKQ